MDQAEGLRILVQKGLESGGPPLPVVQKDAGQGPCPRVLSVTSGKGGVGKTNVVANLAYAFTQMGKKVLVLDADLGLANLDILLGLTPRFTIEHFFNQKKVFSDILIEGPGGMSIMPASSGVLDLVDLSESQKLSLLSEMDLISENIDIFLIDTGAGISSNVMYFNLAAQESIVIATPEPTSITDAYALIKILSTKFHKKHFMILANLVRNGEEGRDVYQKISRVADRFLESLSIDYLGCIPFDEKLPLAVKNQRPVLELYPKAVSSRSFVSLAQTLSEKPFRNRDQGTVQFFWKKLLQSEQVLRQEGGID